MSNSVISVFICNIVAILTVNIFSPSLILTTTIFFVAGMQVDMLSAVIKHVRGK